MSTTQTQTQTPAEQAAKLIQQWQAEAANARDERERAKKVARIRGLSTLRQYQRRQWEECGEDREPYAVEGREIVEGEEERRGC